MSMTKEDSEAVLISSFCNVRLGQPIQVPVLCMCMRLWLSETIRFPRKIRTLFSEASLVEELQHGLQSRESSACQLCDRGMGKRQRRNNSDVYVGIACVATALRKLHTLNLHLANQWEACPIFFTMETLIYILAVTL